MRNLSLSICLILSIASLARGESEVRALIAALPADNVEGGRQVMAELAHLGRSAVLELANAVVPTGQGNDAKARYALNGLAHHVSRPGAEKERAMYAGALARALAEDRPSEVSAFLISMLQRAGHDESVPAIAKFLTDRELGDPAARALASIGTRAAGDALLGALSDADGANRAAILKALGDMRHAPAGPQILRYATADASDAVTRAMALYAVANFGTPQATEVLAAAAADAPAGAERSRAVSLYLLLAQRLAEAGEKSRAVEICRELIKHRTAPAEAHIVCGALATLTKASGPGALDDLSTALDSDNAVIRAAVLELLAPMSGDRVTSLLLAKLSAGDFEQRTQIVRALGRRQDEESWKAVVAGLKDQDKRVRIAAVEAVGRRANDEALSALLEAIARADAEESRAISEALRRIPGDAAMGEVAAAISSVAPPARVALIEALAARHARGQVERVLEAAKDSEASVRLAAIKALRDVATAENMPRMLELLLGGEQEKEQAELMQSIVAVATQGGDAEKGARPVLEALERARGPARRIMIRSLPQIGGAAALAALVEETRSDRKEDRDAAVRALADWRDAGAAPHLLEIAQEDEDATNRILALRGYLRLAGMADRRPVAESVKMYRAAMSAAQRADEKRLAISGLAAIRHVDALKLVAEHAGDEALGAEAALAAMKIVTPQNRSQKALTGDAVTAILEQIAETVKDESAREKIQAHLKATAPDKEKKEPKGR